ncbi:serine/threonine protein kinase [Luteolibacter yonseiensis]|uniref:Serine/threonine protein kinase n=1 Tax=Luteolibacter yonseiensis TaxID=1144680 RepID=A0A934R3P9_9BACT|nr:serine/threonine-protein kinase [Luteolibacter yonseiensis]MBK1817818.1 serine/threonine protein kinase [Luteolibacter yonseiensis]
MPERTEIIAYCHSCGNPMNVAAVAPFSNVECPTCGKHTRVKREFGPYTLVRRHAAGGMSMVFVAHDNTLDREVALKILSEDYSADEKRIAAFEEEARITASFSHPHVVRVLRTGKSFDRFYIAMELVPGGHFEHQIRERGKIPEIEMLPLAIQVAQGLKAAHAAGLIHRDVKPGNILLDAEGHAKLVDFGLALVTQGGKAKAAELWATPYYVPPETIEGDAEDFRSDIYAFGATLYHALAGYPSCGEETMATDILREAKKQVIPLGTADPTLSEGTCRIVERAMAYQPRDRYASYDEMIGQLESALKRLKSGNADSAESSANAARRRAKKKQGEYVTLGAAAVVLLGAASAGIWWITREEPARDMEKPLSSTTSPAVPSSNPAAAVEIAKSYREARAATEARDYEKSAPAFIALSENPSLQEPTRTWAGVEAVLALLLDGKSNAAKERAQATAVHASGLPDERKISSGLLIMLEKIDERPGIPAKDIDFSPGDAAHVIGWMLAGLKNWEQGMPGEASVFFDAVAAAKISPDESWLGIYQNLAREYLEDRQALTAPVFEEFPADLAGCEAARNDLDGILAKLKTRGRARFDVRAWQLDLARHAKLLRNPKPAVLPAAAPEAEPEPVTGDEKTPLAKLEEFAKHCQFSEGVAYLKSLTIDPEGASRASLIMVTEACAVFLGDLETDLTREPAEGEFLMKSGETVRRISSTVLGMLTVTGTDGQIRPAKWEDFSPDALIYLHRYFVKNSKSEPERLRRHEYAICFDWLAGNRERALNAAVQLSTTSTAFRKRWESILSGLPK